MNTDELNKLADEWIEAHDDFVITNEWLLEHRTRHKAWTQKQLQTIGLDWPPQKRWTNTVIGQRISLADKKTFEDAKNIKKKITSSKRLRF